MRRIVTGAAVLVGLLNLQFGVGAEQFQAEVALLSRSFSPASLRVKLGTAVLFKNTERKADGDDAFHSVVAEDGSFNSQQFGPGQVFVLRPTKPGKLRYFCGVHPYMTGEIDVMP